MQRQQTFQNSKPTLYMVATPIGNLNEISKRVTDILNEVTCIFCEDTRVTGMLLNHLNIKKPLICAFESKEKQSSEELINKLANNENIAFMSDAGYPGISDPGSICVSEAIKAGYNVTVVNGPSALIASLIPSGLNTDHFYFYGFLDATSSARKKQLESLKDFKDTIIFYISPHKVLATLQDIKDVLGDRNCCLCRELTKMYEEYLRGKVSEMIEICESLKGEMVLVIEGNSKKEETISLDDGINEVTKLVKNNMSPKDAISNVASKYKLNRKELYNFYQKVKGD